jgi:hypothetical protein
MPMYAHNQVIGKGFTTAPLALHWPIGAVHIGDDIYQMSLPDFKLAYAAGISNHYRHDMILQVPEPELLTLELERQQADSSSGFT